MQRRNFQTPMRGVGRGGAGIIMVVHTWCIILLFSFYIAISNRKNVVTAETSTTNNNSPDAGLGNSNDGDHDDGEVYWWKDWTFHLHYNGDPKSFGTAKISVDNTMKDLLPTTKYEMETFLTRFFAEAQPNLVEYCDMGPNKTPRLLDYDALIRMEPNGTLPCRWYTREGLRIASMEQLHKLVLATTTNTIPPTVCQTTNDDEATSKDNNDDADSSKSAVCTMAKEEEEGVDFHSFHLYGVPAGRVFMFAPSFVGEWFDLSHVANRPDHNKPISMQVISVNPRVFDIFNVFLSEEAEQVKQRVLKDPSPATGMHRSTTGTSESQNVFSKRTSENAFDTHGKVSMQLKKRIFEILGFDEYWHGHDDGLQVLRYNQTKAYTPHMDYLDDHTGQALFNYDSAGTGGNRFATVLLYMNDVPENGGGETVFSQAWPPHKEGDEEETQWPPHVKEKYLLQKALKELRASGDAEKAGIREGSWEEEMVARCRSRLSIKPHAGRAVLFYSQFPNGAQDPMSIHGGCPVLKGEKWAANLWVWNTPRDEHPGAPLRQDLLAKGVQRKTSAVPKLSAKFINTGKSNIPHAELWFDETMFWGNLNVGEEPLLANTYEGHRWNARVNNEIVKEWMIGSDQEQTFEL